MVPSLLALLLLVAAPLLAVPIEPELVSPAQGAAVRAPVRLEALIQDSDGAALDVLFHLRPAAPAEAWEGFSLAVIPDTQFYVYESSGAPVEVFEAQTQWVVDQREEEGIVFTTHLGDVVQSWDDPTEWDLAELAMSHLDGGMPYGIAVGNHDCDYPRGESGLDPACIFDDWFPIERYEAESWWGGSYAWEGAYSSYQLISASGLELLFLHMAMEPDEEELQWGAEVIAAHPDRLVILSTHWFLDPEGNLAGSGPYGAETLWDSLVAPYDNVWFVLSAHVPGESVRSEDVAGHPVHQILSCYQTMDGRVFTDGYLRLMRFEPAAGRVQVETYSPWLDAWMTGDSSTFELDWPVFPYQQTEVEGVTSGSIAQAEWAELEPGTYEWYVSAQDGAGGQASSVLWGFEVLPAEPDTGLPCDSDPPGDSDPSGDSDPPGDSGGEDPDDGCGGCSSAPGVPALPVLLLLGFAAVVSRRPGVS